jgi:hypothetical protein
VGDSTEDGAGIGNAGHVLSCWRRMFWATRRLLADKAARWGQRVSGGSVLPIKVSMDYWTSRVHGR